MLCLAPRAGRGTAARWLQEPRFALKISFGSIFKDANNRRKSKAKLATDFHYYFFSCWWLLLCLLLLPWEDGGLSRAPKPDSGEGLFSPSSAAGEGGGAGLHLGQLVAVSPASARIKAPVLTPLLIP